MKEVEISLILLNVKNYTLYSDKLRLSVLDLTRIDLATDEDKHYQTDYWTALFKVKTWEELKMLAQDNEYIDEASATIYQLSKEEEIRLQCEAREDYYRRHHGMQTMIEELTSENQKLTFENEKLSSENEKLLAWAKEHGYQS